MITFPQFLQHVSYFYTFLYVLWQPPRNSCKMYLIFYTFLYVPWNPLAILAKRPLFLYVPIRSKTNPLRFPNDLEKCLQKGTLFLYVSIRSKKNPLRFPNDLEKCLQKEPYFYTFLYVPKKILYALPVILKNHVKKLYVPLRSNQIPLRPFEKTTIVAQSYDFS